MKTHELVPHPAFPPAEVSRVSARLVSYDANWLCFRWRIEQAGKVVYPAFGGRKRADMLWQTTCFELFVKPEGASAYLEFNLSPSERWAAYAFDTPRKGMRNHPVEHALDCTIRPGTNFALFDAAIPTKALPEEDCSLGISCVIEERGGAKSYWALAHTSEEPDFHDPACFTLALAAPTAR
ncbi:DOMON-like domain-containing protein [Qipengyuania sp. XHP0207]|uniref:DOMON-like domain-containing protein n=1 Tax=Qipengyuania sp. XHP0207 TaxID=3038078 RepID=UPI00241E1E61|nr:DOMON-like domain-containing protein [Qipengyuania sp. XHP0207]MDG5749383.1 DOMON-like domain-containing protein [Qipengyuania sp. XHP0207]